VLEITTKLLANGGTTVVEHAPHHLKVDGLIPAAPDGSRRGGGARENGGKNLSLSFKTYIYKRSILQ
jgi:hypothetical protein